MGNLSIGVGGQSYFDLAQQGKVFSALAIVTAPVIWSTAAGTGGPLLWNNTGPTAGGTTQRVKAVLLALGMGITTASGVAGALGITGAAGQTAAPGSTTAIDAVGNLYVGGPLPLCNTFRVGTPSNAGTFFQPTHAVDTAALTTQAPLTLEWTDLHGAIVVPPGSWASIAATATLTSGVFQIGLMWAEVPF